MSTPDIEFQPAEAIARFQDERLREAVAYAAANSPYYRRVFSREGIDPESVATVESLRLIPFTDKSHLQLYGDDFLCVPRGRIIDYVTTSGTLGEPVTFGCTEADLRRLAFNERKSFECAGITSDDIVQLMTTLDKRFMAGMAYFLGLREIGAGVIRVGNGSPALQWDTIRRVRPDTLMCVPSFVLRLLDYARMNGIDYRRSSVKRIIGIGEGLRGPDFSLNLLGSAIHNQWPEVALFATYSSTEMGATFSECPYGRGGHLHPELVIVEIIGEDGLPVPDGEYGEVVVTTLGVEAMPLIRFRTGDIAAKVTGRCPCGRHSYRLSPLLGRKNNMLKLKGTTLYPPAINDVLDNAPYVDLYVVVADTTPEGTDHVTVRIAINEEYARSGMVSHFDYVKDLKDRLRSRLRVAPDVEICPSGAISAICNPPGGRKPVKFVDNRKLKTTQMYHPRFDDIRPYVDEEIPAAVRRIAQSPLFPTLSAYVFPDEDSERVRRMVASIRSTGEFQRRVMSEFIRQVIARSITQLTVSGLENVKPDGAYLFMSNHRDIVLDSSLLQYALHQRGLPTTDITFGANLMSSPLIVDIGRSNKMFRVERASLSRAFIGQSRHLSDFIRDDITRCGRSVWIAQRNGRTKDGVDATDPGIIKMLCLSAPGGKYTASALDSLAIVPVAVSYEWEPCDYLKAVELTVRDMAGGRYMKRPGEDLNSILSGLLKPKGRVHIEVCPQVEFGRQKSLAGLSGNALYREAAHIVSSRIRNAYRVWPNSYIARDILNGDHANLGHKYDEGQLRAFSTRMDVLLSVTTDAPLNALRNRFLHIYAGSLI